ncbi:MAG: methyltransferase domain-containing protein [Candidatus Edwardsbacteria bacterium]|nr:methyltransferase domain-containing protein [Candidatus Edwardsbacteria bacterium]MBU1576269.1 methyltransferase domain-containing protein [Candidatus Edwardsbacteria bacterium]MBU2462668.1 methyltransferase domain-containing protein [Candidatus Edwardsbacteria bacterium]MBU2594451.1 methyltransferase domain-containing protein [Candidatus Edwardsbacteria bacterium]
MGRIISINISTRKGEKKISVRSAVLKVDHGITGDAHAGDWHRQVSLLAEESVDKMRGKGVELHPGDFAENLTIKGIDLKNLKIGQQLKIASEIILEITQIGKECHNGCAIKQQVGDCVMPREGVFARVIKGGGAKIGDKITIEDLCAGKLMIDDISDIAAFYNNDPDAEHFRLERHQLEFDLTCRYLEKYLPPKGSILEIGAATGRYTIELARQGYDITAVDISEKMFVKCRSLLQSEGLEHKVKFIISDARDLGPVSKNDYDAVLMMGPLYHLIYENDRILALKNVFARLKKDSLIFTTFISRYGIFGEVMKKEPGWIDHESEVRSVLEFGRDPEHSPKGEFRGYFANVSELAPLHEAVGFKTIVVAGVEPGISAEDEIYNTLVGKRRELWLNLLFQTSAEPTTVGASRHLIYIGKK